MELTKNNDYQELLGRISQTYAEGRRMAWLAINTQLTETYWKIGHDIVEYEQGGKAKADYGKALLANLSRDLKLRHGRGFSRNNLVYMRLLYLRYPIGQKPSDQLSWSHYVELLKLDDDLERSFYEQQAIREKWSVPELMRQKKPVFSCAWQQAKTKPPSCNWPRKDKSSNSPTTCCASHTSSSF